MSQSSLSFPAMLVVALSTLVVLTAWQPSAQEPAPTSAGTPGVVVFSEPGFPAVDLAPLDETALRQTLAPIGAVFAGVEQLPAALERTGGRAPRVLVMPYGAAFPRRAWPAILAFLEQGGSLVALGGIPFSVPVERGPDGWLREPSSTAYFKKLGITHTFEVDTAASATWQPGDPAVAATPLVGTFSAERVFALDMRLSNTKDFPDEDGSTGPRDARLRPLVVGVDAAGTRVAAPFLRIDRLQGAFAGGAWLLAPVRGRVNAETVRHLVNEALAGAADFVVRPTYAGFKPGEPVSLSLLLRQPGAGEASAAVDCLVELLEASGRTLSTSRITMRGTEHLRSANLDLLLRTPLSRGLYKVRASLDLAPGLSGAAPVRLRSTTGFWIYDTSMLEGGAALSVKGDQFLRGGRPFPVVGTTYMASDVHRKFLLEPNPYLWDRDFASMKAAGVNLVRTGIWSGWRILMPEVGAMPEAVLRSLDVFLLTARKHDIPVIFTLFAFVPESWTGENPYLDPRSVRAQQVFAGQLARRYAGAQDLVWDLINEPSFSSPARLWQTRPNYDASENAAWQAFLRARHAGATADDPSPILSAWGAPEREGTGLPSLLEFTDRNLFGDFRPQKAFEYRMFAQDAFIGWVRQMTAALRGAADPTRHLITVGQDEGGLVERPGPLFFGRHVDFTCIHTWWNNDALAWDSVLSKRPAQPLMVEETGLMRYERIDGTPWRSEADAASLLERKMVIAFGTGAAGIVQWIWNTNPYMPSDNEAGIGFFRADGSARPELRPFVEVARFARANADRFQARQSEEVALVIPQSQVLSVRDLGTEATRRAVRAMYHHLQLPVRAVGEYEIEQTLGTPRLIVLPSPAVLAVHAWPALLRAVEQGATLLVTGDIDRDAYWRPVARTASLGLSVIRRPVAGTERIDIGGRSFPVGYRGEKLERVERALVQGMSDEMVVERTLGRGRIIWSPLPLELAEPIDATVALYRYAATAAGLAPLVSAADGPPGLFVGVSRFADTVLVALSSEDGADRDIALTYAPSGRELSVNLPAGRAVLLLLDAVTGTIIDRTTPPATTRR